MMPTMRPIKVCSGSPVMALTRPEMSTPTTIDAKPFTPRKNSVLVVSIPARLRRSERLRTVFCG